MRTGGFTLRVIKILQPAASQHALPDLFLQSQPEVTVADSGRAETQHISSAYKVSIESKQ